MDDKEQLDQIAKDLLYDLGITFPIKNEMVVARKLVLAQAEIQQLRESLDIAKEKIASLDIDMVYLQTEAMIARANLELRD